MFAPMSKNGIPAPWRVGEQKNIIEDRFLNLRSERTEDGLVVCPWHFVGHNPKVIEQHTRLRLWKLLREVDVPPVFLLHMEEELFSLLKAKTDKENSKPKPKCIYHRIKEVLENAVCSCMECK